MIHNENNQNQKTKFVFYKTFINAPSSKQLQITMYSNDEEVAKKYKDKVYYINLRKCQPVKIIFKEEDLEYFELYLDYFFHLNSIQIETIEKLLEANNIEELKIYLKSIHIFDAYLDIEKNWHHYAKWTFHNLKIEPKIQKFCDIQINEYVSGLYLLDDKYLIRDDGGYIIVFMKSEETLKGQKEEEKEIIKNDTFTSPITHEMQIPDDFFKK